MTSKSEKNGGTAKINRIFNAFNPKSEFCICGIKNFSEIKAEFIKIKCD